jgi:hypothetical protein
VVGAAASGKTLESASATEPLLIGGALRLDAEGATDRSRAVAHAELVIHVVEVFADRSRREIENAGDLAVRFPSRNPEKDLALAGVSVASDLDSRLRAAALRQSWAR